MVTVEEMNSWSSGKLPGLIGIEICEVAPGRLKASLPLCPELLAPNDYLHAASVVALADSACGYATLANLPEGGRGFTTIELKTNFLGTARAGRLACEARLAHGGRTPQVWDAEVIDEAKGRVIALFRCTQLILYPAEASA
jgi:1,4-dihydroxy-2-naphthoyl-CoA hydrolase